MGDMRVWSGISSFLKSLCSPTVKLLTKKVWFYSMMLFKMEASKPVVLMCVVAATLTFGFLDLKAGGTEISFSIFYLLPISLATWYLSPGFGYGVAAFSLLFRGWIDFSRLDLYSHPFIPLENTALRAVFFIGAVWAIGRIRLLMERERRFGTTDFLTGLPNSRALYEMLAGVQNRCIRAGSPLTIAFMDCDNFKRINDLEGHRAGDKVLALIGETLQQNIRRGDFAARLGGDEFALLLPDTDEEAGLQVLTRLHTSLLKAMETGGHPVTFSVGAVTYADPPEAVDDMLHRADTLMYSVKAQTKNRVVIEQVKS